MTEEGRDHASLQAWPFDRTCYPPLGLIQRSVWCPRNSQSLNMERPALRTNCIESFYVLLRLRGGVRYEPLPIQAFPFLESVQEGVKVFVAGLEDSLPRGSDLLNNRVSCHGLNPPTIPGLPQALRSEESDASMWYSPSTTFESSRRWRYGRSSRSPDSPFDRRRHTPSAECRREPATSSLPPLLGDLLVSCDDQISTDLGSEIARYGCLKVNFLHETYCTYSVAWIHGNSRFGF